MAADSAPTSAQLPLLLLLLALLIGLFIFAFPTLNAQVNTTTQGNKNQCQNGGQSFDDQQEAYMLAQSVEEYRATHPSPANYGLGSYTLCYTDGSGQRFQSPVFPGFKNTIFPSQPPNSSHSEQSVYGWMQNKLSGLSSGQRQGMAIYAIIFSQVSVCVPCQRDMKIWQRTLRAKAKTEQLYLSIWDIIYGKGFDPAIDEAGTGTPVTIDMLRKVPIIFVL